MDLALPTVSGHTIGGTLVQVVDPASGRVLQQAITHPDGSFLLGIRSASAPRGLLIETVLAGPNGPAGYLAAPVQTIQASGVSSSAGSQTVDLDAGSTAAVYTQMELAGMNQTFDVSNLATRQNTTFEQLLARVDASGEIAAASRIVSAYGANSSTDLSTATSQVVQASSELSLRAWQGVLRFGASPPSGVTPEALVSAFVDQIDQQVTALPQATPATVDQAAISAVSAATYQQIVSAAASADVAAGPVPTPGVIDGASSSLSPGQLPSPLPVPTPIATDSLAVP